MANDDCATISPELSRRSLPWNLPLVSSVLTTPRREGASTTVVIPPASRYDALLPSEQDDALDEVAA